MKTPTPSKAAENQKEKGKSEIVTDLFNTRGRKKRERKRNIKHVHQLKANGRYQHQINISNCIYSEWIKIKQT